MTKTFPHLLAPAKLAKLELSNRILMSAMGTAQANEDGTVSEQMAAYYQARAQGGAALVICEAAAVDYPHGCARKRVISLATPAHVESMKGLVSLVHGAGARFALQLKHDGPLAKQDVRERRALMCPSPPIPRVSDIGDFTTLEKQIMGPPLLPANYHPMSVADICNITLRFAETAERAAAAGVDALEVHAGHGFLLSAFLSPAFNRRTDQYGGSVANRARFLIEVIKEIRARVGSELVLWCKIDSVEHMLEDGIKIDDSMETAQLAQEAGVDAIYASAGADLSKGIGHSSSNIPQKPELMVPGAARIKAVVSIPVITSGRIEPARADRLIAEGAFDFLAMGRKLLADPRLPNKLREGRTAETRPCIYCYACISQLVLSEKIKCSVNPSAGLELLSTDRRPSRTKNIVVIGGGPAGMESARLLRLKGHRVRLLEQSTQLGGTLRFAALAYEPNERLLRWLQNQVSSTNVEVTFGIKATVDVVAKLEPDGVIVATGAIRKSETIKSVKHVRLPRVFNPDDLRRIFQGERINAFGAAERVLTKFAGRLARSVGDEHEIATVRSGSKLWMPFGRRVAVIGADLVGLELAEFLVHRGRQVTLLHSDTEVGSGLYIVRRWRVLAELREANVRIICSVTDIALGESEISFSTAERGVQSIACDDVIIARGAMPNLDLVDQLRRNDYEVHSAGDCGGVSFIEGAMRSAAHAVESIG